jgi:endonuclease-3 related protein
LTKTDRFSAAIREGYRKLLAHHSPQGWWPLTDLKNPSGKSLSERNGYHPSDFSYPRSDNQVYEICVGAILTQNTTWIQVEKSLYQLKRAGCLDPRIMAETSDSQLKPLIKSTGYYNQKYRKIKRFTTYFLAREDPVPTREDLLKIWGIGPETADSIRLYAFRQPCFVVDAYTCRWIQRYGGFADARYQPVQSAVHRVFSTVSPEERVRHFNEFHALLVIHGKEICRKIPLCSDCPLKDCCIYYIKHDESHEK